MKFRVYYQLIEKNYSRSDDDEQEREKPPQEYLEAATFEEIQEKITNFMEEKSKEFTSHMKHGYYDTKEFFDDPEKHFPDFNLDYFEFTPIMEICDDTDFTKLFRKKLNVIVYDNMIIQKERDIRRQAERTVRDKEEKYKTYLRLKKEFEGE